MGCSSRREAETRERNFMRGGIEASCAAKVLLSLCIFSFMSIYMSNSERAQQLLGGITGTVTDSTGAVVPQTAVKIHGPATGLQ